MATYCIFRSAWLIRGRDFLRVVEYRVFRN